MNFTFINKYGAFLVLVVAFLAYANTLNHGFVLDDKSAITDNSSVQKGIGGISEIWSNSYMYGYSGTNEESYRPISLTLFAIEKAIFKSSSTPFHLIHILLYSLLCFILFKWLQLLFEGSSKLAFFLSLLFALHPIHTEVVANLKSADELLALLFGVLSFYYFSKYLIHRLSNYWLYSILFFFLAILSKETALTYLLVYPLLVWFSQSSYKKDWVAASSNLMPVIFYFILRSLILTDITFEEDSIKVTGQNNALLFAENNSEFFGTTFSILVMYFKKLLIPLQLSYDYSFNQIPIRSFTDFKVLVSLAVLLGLIIAGIITSFKKNKIGLGIAILIGTLTLSSNLLVPIAATAAERFLFSPSLGFIMCVGFTYESLEAHLKRSSIKNILMAIGLVVLVAFAYLTTDRNKAWESNETLFLTDVETSSNSFRAHHFAGTAYKDIGLNSPSFNLQQEAYSNAEKSFIESIKIYPEFIDNYIQLAEVFKLKQEYGKAEKTANAGLKREKGNVDLLMHLGDVYLQSRQFVKAQETFYQLLDIVDKSKAYIVTYNLAASYYNELKFEEAIPYFKNALKIDPSNQDGLYFIGVSLYELQRYQEAIDHLILVGEGNGNYPWCQFTIGTSYLMLENYAEAVTYLDKSLAYSPNEIGALSAIAKAHSELGDMEKVKEYQDRIIALRK